MTIQTTSSKAGPFIGNGSTTTFACNFLIDKPDDLQVVYTDALAQDTTLDPSQYTATGFGDPAGVTVTYPISGPPIGANEKLTLLRLIDYDQQTSITNQGGFYPTVIEKALDRIVMQCQQLAEKVGRAISVSVSSSEDPNAAFRSIAVNAAIAEEAASEASGSASDAAMSAEAAAASAASIEKPLPVASGGTGAETAAAARANLGLGSAAALDAGMGANEIMQLDANGKAPAVSALNMLDTGRLIAIRDFTASGTYVKNLNASYVVVYVLGGGGGAGSAQGGASATGVGGGGCGGGCAIKRISTASLAATETVTVGSGGTGAAAATVAQGGAGGTSSFGVWCSATGGDGGTGNTAGVLNWEVYGGIGIGGDINLRGQSPSGGGNAQSNSYHQNAGAPGAGPFGGGGAPGVNPTGVPKAGINADANTGAGGSGGQTAYNTTASRAAGGNGGSGRVIIFEYA